MQRLEGYLSGLGLYPRKQWRTILKAGRVQVNGRTVTDRAMQIDPARDEVCLDGRRAAAPARLVLMLHKPAGYVTATEDAAEPTVMELLPEQYRARGLRPVGRLDKQTEGLLLFTDDGELLHRLISPRHEVDKVYYARHEGQASQEDVRAFAEGLLLRDGTKCRPAILRPLGAGESEITVCEGKYHQVRRMMASRGLPVVYLKRIAFGSLKLGDLAPGKVRELSENEIVTI